MTKLNDLRDGLLDYIRESLGPKKEQTLEEALQEALDNSTPEQAGAPRKETTDGRAQNKAHNP